MPAELIGWVQLFIACCVFIGSSLLAVLKFGWMSKEIIDDIKADYNARLMMLEKEQDTKRNELSKEQEAKIALVFKRFDDYKKNIETRMETTLVRKDNCELIRNGFAQTLVESNVKIRELCLAIEEVKSLLIQHMTKDK